MAFRLLKDAVVELVVLAMIVALGLIMLGTDQGMAKQLTENSTEYNATVKAVESIATIPDWYGILILAIVFLAMLGIVFLIQRMAGTSEGQGH